jgi:hypothetical protein
MGSRNNYTTFVKSDNGIIYATCERFHGTIDAFKENVLKMYDESSIHRKTYLLAIRYAIDNFNI